MRQLDNQGAQRRLLRELLTGRHIYLYHAADAAKVSRRHALRLAQRDNYVSLAYGKLITRRYNRALQEWEEARSLGDTSQEAQSRHRLHQAQQQAARWQKRTGRQLALQDATPRQLQQLNG